MVLHQAQLLLSCLNQLIHQLLFLNQVLHLVLQGFLTLVVVVVVEIRVVVAIGITKTWLEEVILKDVQCLIVMFVSEDEGHTSCDLQ